MKLLENCNPGTLEDELIRDISTAHMRDVENQMELLKKTETPS